MLAALLRKKIEPPNWGWGIIYVSSNDSKYRWKGNRLRTLDAIRDLIDSQPPRKVLRDYMYKLADEDRKYLPNLLRLHRIVKDLEMEENDVIRVLELAVCNGKLNTLKIRYLCWKFKRRKLPTTY